MEFKIIGNGGAYSNGLAYNSFMIGPHILVETPPDIMNSLFAYHIDLKGIQVIYISHYHGDHYFGFPFIALRLFMEKSEQTIRVYGPQGLKDRLFKLTIMAFGQHPILDWIESYIDFIEINREAEGAWIGGLEFKTIFMNHFQETYGFALFRSKKNIFTYWPDTLWSEDLKKSLQWNPPYVLCDLNGEDSQEDPKHMRPRDILQLAVPGAPNTLFLGTHLKENKVSTHDSILYVISGDTFSI